MKKRRRALIFATAPPFYSFYKLAYTFTQNKEDRKLYESFKYLLKAALRGNA